MKKLSYITSLALIAILSACDSGDAPIQRPDNYDYITFSAQTQKLLTRANPYEAYSPEKHPLTMGAFGYHDITSANSLNDAIFSNETVSYDAATTDWTTATLKKWTDYKTANSFDFFAYMPQSGNATLNASTADTYTLSVPVAMTTERTSADGSSSSVASPAIFYTKQAPIICALPEHKEGKDFSHMVSMKFDQTLTAYNIQFMLDSKMGAIRQFRIKSVTLSGELATAGTVSRTYKWTGTEWTAGKILWTNIQRMKFAASDIAIPYKESSSANADNDSKSITVKADDYTPWGDTFYVIPDDKFQPTISVTYDTEFVGEDGKTVVTRKDITSTIILNKDNFSNLATGSTAMINPIRILIQPRYLYVLADGDAYNGYLLID